MSVEGQRSKSTAHNPWANYQRFGRRLSNRNRAHDKPNQRASVRALPKAKSEKSSAGTREGKNLRSTFPFNSAASAGHDHHHDHGSASGSNRRPAQGIASNSISALAPPALGILYTAINKPLIYHIS